MSTAESPMLLAALEYAGRGLVIFPVRGKRPLTSHGFHDATADEIVIREWWATWPDAGIGMPTGSRTGRVVLDIDDDEALEAFQREYGRLPQTATVLTPRGGRHFHYRHPGEGHVVRNAVGLRGFSGLDLRGDGGYVVVPPSPGYRWEPGAADLTDVPTALLVGATHTLDAGAAIRSASVLLEGGRNSGLTSLAGTMRRRGMSEEAIRAALQEENRVRCQPPLFSDEVDRIAASIARYTAGDYVFERPAETGMSVGDREVALVSLADVEPRAVDWIWEGRIPRGTVTLIVGDPGLGKSFLTLDLAARISGASRWPDGSPAPIGHTLVLTAEDGLADTVVPRLGAMGATLANVHAVTGVRDAGQERPFVLATDLARLDEEVEKAPWRSELSLVVIDPLSAYLGSADPHVDAKIRMVLAPLAAFADRRRVAVMAVMHLNKATQMRALYRPGGSIAFVAAARAVFAVTSDPSAPDSPRRLFGPLKMNLAPHPPVLAFSVSGVPARVEWERAPVNGVDIEAALRGSVPDDDRGEREAAMDFLREELASGPRPAADMLPLAQEAGIAPRTLDRAKAALGVRALRDGGLGQAGRWIWELPNALRTPNPGKDATREGDALSEPLALLADPMLRAATETGLLQGETEHPDGLDGPGGAL